MRTEVIHDVVERNAEMLHETYFRTRFIIERYRLIEDCEVTCFLDICYCSEDQPHRVIVESTSDIVVSSLGKRLVLVVATSVRELG